MQPPLPDRLEAVRQGAHALPWHQVLSQILAICNGQTARGRAVAGNATQYQRRKMLLRIFRELRQRTPYKLNNPFNIGDKHVDALAALWIADALAPKTIVSLLSTLRVFCAWIGKAGLVRPPAHYVGGSDALRVSQVNRRDKSWEGNGIDFAAMIPSIVQMDKYVSMQAKAMHAFGLRVREAVRLRPIAARHGDMLHITAGTKGGRPRLVPIDTAERRATIEELETFALRYGKSGGIADPKCSLKQQLRRLYYVFRCVGLTRKDLGVTAHGLRHQYAIVELEKQGVTSPVRGGVAPPLSGLALDRLLLQISEKLGHSRVSVTAAYYGSFKQPNRFAREVMASAEGQAKLQQIQAVLARAPLSPAEAEVCKRMLDGMARKALEAEQQALQYALAQGQAADTERLA